ncbi:hypothetical protein GCM10010123_33820 [Pilimelia anulata]|uniref:Peptidase S1A alpha-lytic prodomain domain-containing protein n=1 Tax=Pilimelia anulata TaxID=53371 RepID=A0A8J3BB56_9ACTN|nr:S1 family peptidase [Pilimelia anulata]GGK01030.1 hypothetical protein GCM10010123_33820 [Pilimelia anulata]
MDTGRVRVAAVVGVAVVAAAAVTVPALAEQDDDGAGSPYVQFVARDLKLSPRAAAARVQREATLADTGNRVDAGLGDLAGAAGGRSAAGGGGKVDIGQIAGLIAGAAKRGGGNDGGGNAGGGGAGGFDPALIAQLIQLGAAAGAGAADGAANNGGGGNVDAGQIADGAAGIAGLIGALGGAGGAAGPAGLFSGTWATGNGRTLNVGVTDRRTANAVRRAGGTPKLVRYNAAQLATVKADLDSRARNIGSRSAAGWYVDPASNSVVVLAAPGQEQRASSWAYRNGAPGPSIRVVRSAERPRPLIDVRGADPYLINSAARCSVGFAVQGGFVSAGHCGTAGQRTTAGADEQFQGLFGVSSFPGDDFSFIRTASTFTPIPAVATERGLIPVTGAAEAPVGTTVCRSGSTTGTRCGVIQSKDATVNYAEGAVPGLTRTSVCAEPGDSGGPFFSGTQAQGMTSGGSGDCVVGGTTFFQPVTEVLDRVGLNLLVLRGGANAEANASAGGGAVAVARAGGAVAGAGQQIGPPAVDPGSGAAPNPGGGSSNTGTGGGNRGSSNGGNGSSNGNGNGNGNSNGNSNGGGDSGAVNRPVACRNADAAFTGELGTGDEVVQPDGGSFRADAGPQTVCLTGPGDADFDLSLEKWSGLTWNTVASGVADGSTEVLRYTGDAGLYRVRIATRQGTGAYTVSVG